ncbi:MAG: hypothetical protein GX025_00235 [Clostridiales bacterium]|nr:hypothetical protein [Clostridiales bacterium]
MIKISGIKAPIGESKEKLKARAAEMLGISPEEIRDFSISRISVDARKKSDVHQVFSVTLSADKEKRLLKAARNKNICLYETQPYEFPKVSRKSSLRPVIVGLGPAGLFAAYELARAGLPPIILERGGPVEKRSLEVEGFWKTGSLSEISNVQFGEGGAGTFSDGKLNTGINDPRVRHIFETFVSHGAPEDILWTAKPHIGTDVLRTLVKSMRQELLSLGCEIRFEHKLSGLKIKNNALCGILVEGETGFYEMPCDSLILAVGHSARDTFKMLYSAGLNMEQKPFAIGLRIEHDQNLISQAQYGNFADKLPAADYKLSCHLPNGRSAYSFCVCPGGQVVAAASENGKLVTNGMSSRARDGQNINGGFLVGVRPSDFENAHPLAGIAFQEKWESLAFSLGGGDFKAPVQTVGDFLEKRASRDIGSINPTYLPDVKPSNLDLCLPDFVTETLRAALLQFDRSLHGFGDKNALLTGVETRSSSPLRILRDESFQSTVRGIYPCGEGAGYAGGISSAAADGIKTAEALATRD